MKKSVILWYQNDLRIHDHEALHTAAEKGFDVIPVYIIDSFWNKPTSFGFEKFGKHKKQFLFESLQNLAENLKRLGSNLLVLEGDTSELLSTLTKKYNCSLIYAERAVTDEEKKIQQKAEKTLPDIDFAWFFGESLYHPNDLPHPYQETPDVFTKFRKGVEKKSSVRPLFPTPEKIDSPAAVVEHTIDWNGLSFFESRRKEALTEKSVLPFAGGEDEGLKRLQHYFWDTHKLQEYKHTRNGMLGADYSSKFSPWLAFGCLSPRKIYWEVKRFEKEVKSNQSTYWLIFELIWRDFFTFYALKHGNKMFWLEGTKKETPKLSQNREIFEKWAQAQTGIPFVDANMHELNETGFMSNRGRQNVASFLVKDLKIDWRMGAEYFESLLIDYDVCSNWGNWNYVSGVGADPREGRYFNVLWQARKYDAKGEYVKHWIEDFAAFDSEEIFNWSKGHFNPKITQYPKPLVIPEAFEGV